jgi:photosystem II stability/assembly factor-like uncharacterized protein
VDGVRGPARRDLSLAVASGGSLFAATTSGLWERTDDAWVSRLDGEAITAIASSAGDRNSGRGVDRIVVGTLDGSLRSSSDGGRTWSTLSSVRFDEPVRHIALHPTDADVVAVATADESVHLSLDGGSTWVLLADTGTPITEPTAAD